MAMRWYTVHVYSGFENSVREKLQERIDRADMQSLFGEILVPVEEVVEMKGGQKSISKRKFVTGFVGGSGNRPIPITDKEVENIRAQVKEGEDKPKPKVLFEVGESVRVKEGPFTDFHGNVEEVNYDKNKLRVSVLIFGRATPVELDFGQVEKA